MLQKLSLVLAVLSICGAVVLADSETEPEDKSLEPMKVVSVDYKDHHASTSIWGTWEFDSETTKSLNPGQDMKEKGDMTDMVIEITTDNKASAFMLEHLPTIDENISRHDIEGPKESRREDFVRALTEVFTTGKLEMTNNDFTVTLHFALVVFRGEPTMLTLEKKPSGKVDWETARYGFLNDPKGDGDRLFIAGDRAKEPYICLKRKKVD